MGINASSNRRSVQGSFYYAYFSFRFYGGYYYGSEKIETVQA